MIDNDYILLENLYNSLLEKKEDLCIDEFIEKRSMGAKKIQQQAQEKGGPALLTSVHFKAKEKPYDYCSNNYDNIEKITKKADEIFDKLKNWKDMSQKDFQHYMGMLEAYGEIVIKIKKPNSLVD
jgi:putative sterol carrier protein